MLNVYAVLFALDTGGAIECPDSEVEATIELLTEMRDLLYGDGLGSDPDWHRNFNSSIAHLRARRGARTRSPLTAP